MNHSKPKRVKFSQYVSDLVKLNPILPGAFTNDEKGMLLKLIYSFKFGDKRSKHIWKPFSKTAAAVMHARLPRSKSSQSSFLISLSMPLFAQLLEHFLHFSSCGFTLGMNQAA